MQNVADGDVEELKSGPSITIQSNDILSIVVSSNKPGLAVVLNKPLLSFQAGSASDASSYNQRLLGYLVDPEGNIDFPILGLLSVKGMTRNQLSEMIKQRILDENLLEDPIVSTEFMNLRISVLGEVRNPGTFTVTNDKISLLEALGRAGDLTIYGRRENVLVHREIDGIIYYHRVNLNSDGFIHSPVYYLRQNDVVYVEPNKIKAEESGINSNRSLSVWVSLASFLTTLAVLFVK